MTYQRDTQKFSWRIEQAGARWFLKIKERKHWTVLQDFDAPQDAIAVLLAGETGIPRWDSLYHSPSDFDLTEWDLVTTD